MAKAAPHMQLAPDLDTGPAQLGRGGVCEGCAAEPLALLQRREKQAAARRPVGRVWPFSRRRPALLVPQARPGPRGASARALVYQTDTPGLLIGYLDT